jgi:hypothetical protein
MPYDRIQMIEGWGGLGITEVTQDELMLEGVGLQAVYDAQMGSLDDLHGPLGRKIKSALRSFTSRLLEVGCSAAGSALNEQCNKLSGEARTQCNNLATQGVNIFCREIQERLEVQSRESLIEREADPPPVELVIQPARIRQQASAPVSPIVPVVVGGSMVAALFFLL